MPPTDALFPWLQQPLVDALQRRAHALLVTGPAGLGQFELSLALVQAWLCEATPADRPAGAMACGRCDGCHLVAQRSHPDLRLLVPEAFRAQAGLEADEGEGEDGKKRKPSQEIKVDQVRATLDFSERTAGRAPMKVVLVHPAEALNAVAANALLKTLEEPPGAMRFVLGCGAVDSLLPTIRSRCQSIVLRPPPREQALAWLDGQGIDGAEAVLDASSGMPPLALEHVKAGRDAAVWRALPAQVQAGDAAAFAGWPLPALADALGRLVHDAAAVRVGAPARYFRTWQPRGPAADIAALTGCASELRRFARQAEHPWNAALTVESLVARVCETLTPR